MKKLFTLLFLTSLLTAQSQMAVVGWDFPDGSADLIADTGSVENFDREIGTFGGTSVIEFKNGYEEKAAQASGWEDAALAKGWEINFTTAGYYVIHLTSRQQSGGNDPGPKYWIIQYKVGEAGEWTDVEGSGYEVANDWETGYIEDLVLPGECDNQELVYVRWLVTDNESSGGGAVLPDGKSKIDNILITADGINNIGEGSFASRLRIGPNPAADILNISIENGRQEEYVITDISGRPVSKGTVNGSTTVDVTSLPEGMYLVRITDHSETRKILVRRSR